MTWGSGERTVHFLGKMSLVEMSVTTFHFCFFCCWCITINGNCFRRGLYHFLYQNREKMTDYNRFFIVQYTQIRKKSGESAKLSQRFPIGAMKNISATCFKNKKSFR